MYMNSIKMTSKQAKLVFRSERKTVIDLWYYDKPRGKRVIMSNNCGMFFGDILND